MSRIKSFFATPKKAIISVCCILAVLIVCGVGSVYAASAIIQSSAIGEENAKNFAFADAGVDPASAENVRAKFDFDDGKFVYEVEFIAGGSEYGYWIQSSDGTVLKKEVGVVTQNGTQETATAQISLDEAKEIALEDAGLSASQVSFTKEKLDVDDGVSVYDIDFFAENTEYEYEINANTGAIFSKSKESFVQATPQPSAESSNSSTVPEGNADLNQQASGASQSGDKTSGETSAQSGGQNQTGQAQNSYIDVDRAKEIAVAQSGFDLTEVVLKKAKMDYEDGVMVYEIEYYKDGMEYDCEIDAVTGTVMKYDQERDD